MNIRDIKRINRTRELIGTPSTEREIELERMLIEMSQSAQKYHSPLQEERKDAERWRWLRQCKGWPESENEVSGYSPEEFDLMADKFMGKKNA